MAARIILDPQAADEPENDQGASEAGAFKQLVTELPGLLPAGGLVVRLVAARSSLAIRPLSQPIFCGVSERLATPFQLRKTPRGGTVPLPRCGLQAMVRGTMETDVPVLLLVGRRRCATRRCSTGGRRAATNRTVPVLRTPPMARPGLWPAIRSRAGCCCATGWSSLTTPARSFPTAGPFRRTVLVAGTGVRSAVPPDPLMAGWRRAGARLAQCPRRRAHPSLMAGLSGCQGGPAGGADVSIVGSGSDGI